MTSLKSFIVVVVLFLVVGGWFGSVAWRKCYQAPRAKLEQQKTQLTQQIDGGTKTLASMRNTIGNNMTLFSRSFPLDRDAAQSEYRQWLTQLGEFCDMDDLRVTPGEYRQGRNIATRQYQVRAKCAMSDLYRFLYEFSWTTLLHRINSLDVNSLEKSDLLDITLVIETFTLARPNPQSPYPLANRLPLGPSYLQRLASGPFQAYEPVAHSELFRYSTPGIDAASYVILTGTPAKTNPADGSSVVYSRWKFETQSETVQLKVGEKLAVGSFEGVIEAIQGELVVVRQNTGYRWVVMLGERLSDAVAVPPELF